MNHPKLLEATLPSRPTLLWTLTITCEYSVPSPRSERCLDYLALRTPQVHITAPCDVCKYISSSLLAYILKYSFTGNQTHGEPHGQ